MLIDSQVHVPFCTDTCLGLTQNPLIYKEFPLRRGGRVAEGGGLLNRYTLSRRIKGSNPFLSAIPKGLQ